MADKSITVALAGNPNSGKSTIFSNLTGSRQKIGNWPGVTVEKKEGHLSAYGYDLTIVDLPGTYSLTAYTVEEIVARNFILDEQPDVVVDVIDASNLERNLYLATQLRELDTKVVFVLNMADMIEQRGLKIDGEKLSELLDVPVIFTVGNANKGTQKLLSAIVSIAETGSKVPPVRRVHYGKDVEQCIDEVAQIIDEEMPDRPYTDVRWVAIKLLEDDKVIKDRLKHIDDSVAEVVLEAVAARRERLRGLFDDEPEIVMTDYRYGFVAGVVKEVVKTISEHRADMSRRMDEGLTNRLLGIPVFVFFIWAMFQITFTVGAYPMDWIEVGVGWLSGQVSRLLPSGIFEGLIVDGIIAGVGSVAVFFPNILILFFCIAIFEDTGYMARAAFLMDKVMHLIGLHGKSFIPMLMGFGCNVPAIMATRTLESHKDRVLTILINPLMSCSARLPVYILLAGAFFGAKAGNVIFSVYFLGIVLAILMGRLFRSTLLRGEVAPFVMELPPYRVPMLRSLLIHMWDRAKVFLKKMGGVILIGSVVVWVLSSYPKTVTYSVDYEARIDQLRSRYALLMKRVSGTPREVLQQERDKRIAALEARKASETVEKSYMGRIGKGLAPVLEPIGIDWRGTVAVLSGFVAKEIVVSTMGVLYAVGGDEQKKTTALKSALRKSGMTPLSAYAMMAFILIYVPCLATVAVIRRETNSWKWAFFSMGYSTALAWVVAFVIFQGGQLLGFG